MAEYDARTCNVGLGYSFWKDYVYIFEFKLDGTAAEALQQIEEKGYATPYLTDTRRVTGVGISFSSITMTVEEWEEKIW